MVSNQVKDRRTAASGDEQLGAIPSHVTLPKAQYRRRLDAALVLAGKKRNDLKEPLERYGLKRNAAARAGHDSDEAMPNEALAAALGKILGVGRAWFEEPDLGKLIPGATEPGALPVDAEGRMAEEDLRRREGPDEGRQEPGEGKTVGT